MAPEGESTTASDSDDPAPIDRIPGLLELVQMAIDDPGINNLYHVLEQAIASSSRRLDEASGSGDEWWQQAMTDDENNRIEQLLGWAFLAAQIYITTVRERVKVLSDACHEARIMNMEIERINAIANYWKHREEWPACPPRKGKKEVKLMWNHAKMKPIQKKTAEIVESIGMSPSSSGNLFIAAKAFGVTEFEDLSPLRNKLHGWARSLLEKAKSEVAALESEITSQEARSS